MAIKDFSKYIYKKTAPEDKRTFFIRLLSSLSVKLSFVRDKRTKKPGACIEVTGGTDF